jgi:hypothetical protein
MRRTRKLLPRLTLLEVEAAEVTAWEWRASRVVRAAAVVADPVAVVAAVAAVAEVAAAAAAAVGALVFPAAEAPRRSATVCSSR